MKNKEYEEKDEKLNFLAVNAGVRFWWDSTVNGTDCTYETLIPFREGDRWKPVIDVTTGKIVDWPEGVTASIHFKVCDDGQYSLLNEKKEVFDTIESYVPNCLSIDDQGFGDYIILSIDKTGQIKNWKFSEDDVDELYESQF